MQEIDRLLSDHLPTGYETRYADNWSQISRKTEEASGGYCCYPGCWARGSEAHHVAYRDEKGAIAGREQPGVHVFWLCANHHSQKRKTGAHHPNNWNSGFLPPPTLDACNTTAYYLKLREGFKEKKSWRLSMQQQDPEYRFQTRSNGFKRASNLPKRKNAKKRIQQRKGSAKLA